ncbi:DUF5131 family protein [Breznakia pachnodae]|uniref:Protein gp37 n=1 Tax=Breznakia pachnodae TaxID=265178 RepID=A0ABU0E728_9FIRM|nr:DUF5131 family protein [Breznakia pachnodae]MDQ0362513.1 protein gp37 [Breznakia pachnodae]
MNNTKIEWCDVTINPVIGCTHGCPYCYAKRMNDRFGWIDDWSTPQFFPNQLMKLKDSKEPKNIFMNSMSDIADWQGAPFISLLSKIECHPKHNYLFLTKRPEELNVDASAMLYMLNHNYPSHKLWFGVTVTNTNETRRMDVLYQKTMYINEVNRFISIEPMLDRISFLPLKVGFHWIIIGAETGNRKGKVIPKKEWIDHIVHQANRANVPVFMKDSLISIVGEANMKREFPKRLRKV